MHFTATCESAALLPFRQMTSSRPLRTASSSMTSMSARGLALLKGVNHKL